MENSKNVVVQIPLSEYENLINERDILKKVLDKDFKGTIINRRLIQYSMIGRHYEYTIFTNNELEKTLIDSISNLETEIRELREVNDEYRKKQKKSWF